MTYPYCKVPLTKGKYAIVDEDCYDFLSRFKWCITSGGYAKTAHGMYMHKMITGFSSSSRKAVVDHINGDKLDNRMVNLRVTTQSINALNTEKTRGSSSYRGVWIKNKDKGTYYSQFRRKYLGSFKTEIEAAEAYRKARAEYIGRTA